ncbi:MAG: DUF6279 family lipoprotein [Thiolinea sp.]
MKYLFILLAALSLSACSYSPEQLRSSYNGMGKDYAKDIKQMADFSDEQHDQIDGFGQQIQQWHRKERLPAYATLITGLGKQLQQSDYIPRQDISRFIDLLNGYPHFNEASAVNYQLGKLAQGLNQTQLNQIIEQLHAEQREAKTEIRAQTPELRERHLVKMVDGIADYLGVELHKSQLDIVREYAPNYHDLGEASITAYTRWYSQLETLLRQHKQADFPQRFAKHMQLDNDHYLISQQEPQLVQANREQAIQMLEALLASMDEEQKATLATTLISVGETFAGMMQ